MHESVALLARKDKELDWCRRRLDSLEVQLARYETMLDQYKGERDQLRFNINIVGQKVSV